MPTSLTKRSAAPSSSTSSPISWWSRPTIRNCCTGCATKRSCSTTERSSRSGRSTRSPNAMPRAISPRPRPRHLNSPPLERAIHPSRQRARLGDALPESAAGIVLEPELARVARDRVPPRLVLNEDPTVGHELGEIGDRNVVHERDEIIVERRADLLNEHGPGQDRLRNTPRNDAVVAVQPAVVEDKLGASKQSRETLDGRRLLARTVMDDAFRPQPGARRRIHEHPPLARIATGIAEIDIPDLTGHECRLVKRQGRTEENLRLVRQRAQIARTAMKDDREVGDPMPIAQEVERTGVSRGS